MAFDATAFLRFIFIVGLVIAIVTLKVKRKVRQSRERAKARASAGGGGVAKAPAHGPGGNGVFSETEIAKHNTEDDCWIVIETDGKRKVYDVTDYVDEHPGGDAILRNAGGDSTAGFFGPQHPTRVFDILEDFCIGTVSEINVDGLQSLLEAAFHTEESFFSTPIDPIILHDLHSSPPPPSPPSP